MTDRLTLTRAFEGAGIGSEAAERIATEIYDAIHDNVATKADLARVEAALKADIIAVRADLAAVRAELSHKIDTMVARLVAAVVVALGVLFAALQHWPPH
jgi:hypothetical protein